MVRILVLLLLVALVPSAHASDGALEINQACVATGCFPGDAPGFPVETPSGGNFVLTSNLVLPSANTSGVVVGAGSTLDLSGFSIRGVATCTGAPAVCSNTGSGTGVTLGEGATLRNGTVQAMGSNGVNIAALALVENLLIDGNGAAGIGGGVSNASIVRGCRITRNGGDGINVAGGNASPGSIVSDNAIYGNGGDGIRINAAVIRDNNIYANGGLGFSANFIDASSGFGGNVINGNNGGNGNAQTSGGHSIGTNVCGDKTTCP